MTNSIRVNVHEGVENESAYVSATKAKIAGRARAKKLATFLATAEGKRAHDFLMQTGEFEATINGYPIYSTEEYILQDMFDAGYRVVRHPCALPASATSTPR